MHRGFFSIGIYHPKSEVNIGSLLRTAYIYGVSYIFTIGKRYRNQASDTTRTTRHVPLFEFDDLDSALRYLPRSSRLIGVELAEESRDLRTFCHPHSAAYLLGAEDHGLPEGIKERCHLLLKIPSVLPHSLNVSVAGSIVVWDRWSKNNPFEGESKNGD